ncbi:hypothetical protein [Tsukamurella hominis]|uniref:hypothetical protein n=1 Tax=Tsukamurella TaxID=2060 RepID=UPI0039E7CCDA
MIAECERDADLADARGGEVTLECGEDRGGRAGADLCGCRGTASSSSWAAVRYR